MQIKTAETDRKSVLPAAVFALIFAVVQVAVMQEKH